MFGLRAAAGPAAVGGAAAPEDDPAGRVSHPLREQDHRHRHRPLPQVLSLPRQANFLRLSQKYGSGFALYVGGGLWNTDQHG